MDNQSAEKPKKTIYSSSCAEIFFKNLLAGMGKAIGSLIIWFILVFGAYRLFFPQFSSYLESLTNTLEILQRPPSNQNSINPQQINQLIEQLTPTKK